MVNVTFHAFPRDTWLLTAPVESPMPVANHFGPKGPHCAKVHWNTVISVMTIGNGLKPFSDFRHRMVHTLFELKSNLFELGPHFLLLGLANYRKHSVPALLPTNMGETKKVECLWLPCPRFLALAIAQGPNSMTWVLSG